MGDEIRYPKPNFHFRVDWYDGSEMQCSEVSGLDVELDEIEYRYGSSAEFSVTKMSRSPQILQYHHQEGCVQAGQPLFRLAQHGSDEHSRARTGDHSPLG